MNKGKMNIVVSVIIFIAVIAILVFISIKSKKGDAPMDSQMGDAMGQTSEENTMDQDTTTPATVTGTAATFSATDAKSIKATITKPGTGATAKAGDTVSMNYTGKFTDGTSFDSNVDPKFQHVEPFEFKLGGGQVIKGWDVGIVGMKVGEKRHLVIQPDYGYGAAGAGSVIPPNAILTFDVELVGIK